MAISFKVSKYLDLSKNREGNLFMDRQKEFVAKVDFIMVHNLDKLSMAMRSINLVMLNLQFNLIVYQIVDYSLYYCY